VIARFFPVLLAQVQKGKVDMQQAMAALDKLMRANELNFQLIAIIPATLLAGWAVRTARDTLLWLLSTRAGLGKGRSVAPRLHLTRLARLLNSAGGFVPATPTGDGLAAAATSAAADSVDTAAAASGLGAGAGAQHWLLQGALLAGMGQLTPPAAGSRRAALETMCEVLALGGVPGADPGQGRRRNAMGRLWSLYGL